MLIFGAINLFFYAKKICLLFKHYHLLFKHYSNNILTRTHNKIIIGERERAILVGTVGDFSIYIYIKGVKTFPLKC